MKTISEDFKNLFKKVTGLNILDVNKIINSCETEADAKKKIAWLVKGGVITAKEDIAKLCDKINLILDDDESTVDSWEVEEEDINNDLDI